MTPVRPIELSYASKPKGGAFVWLYVGQLIPASILAVFFGGLLLFVMPHFREIFNDFRTTLPVITEALLRFSDGYARGGWVLTPVVLALIPLPLALIFRGVENRGRVFLIVLISVCVQLSVGLLVFFVLVVGLFLPLVKLIHATSSGV